MKWIIGIILLFKNIFELGVSNDTNGDYNEMFAMFNHVYGDDDDYDTYYPLETSLRVD